MSDKQQVESTTQPTTSIDTELDALKAVGAALVNLDDAARDRVVRWAIQYFKIGSGFLGGMR